MCRKTVLPSYSYQIHLHPTSPSHPCLKSDHCTIITGLWSKSRVSPLTLSVPWRWQSPALLQVPFARREREASSWFTDHSPEEGRANPRPSHSLLPLNLQISGYLHRPRPHLIPPLPISEAEPNGNSLLRTLSKDICKMQQILLIRMFSGSQLQACGCRTEHRAWKGLSQHQCPACVPRAPKPLRPILVFHLPIPAGSLAIRALWDHTGHMGSARPGSSCPHPHRPHHMTQENEWIKSPAPHTSTWEPGSVFYPVSWSSVVGLSPSYPQQ